MIRKVVKHLTAVCVLIAISVFLSACGTPHSSQPEFLYISGQNQIATFSINRIDGSLSVLPAVSGPNNSLVTSKTMTTSPDAKFLYDYDVSNNAIVGFSIDPTDGSLTAINGSPFSVSSSGLFPAPGTGLPGGMITDPAGKFLYLANVLSLSVFDRDSQSGALTSVSSPTFQVTEIPFEVVTDTTGKFLYSSDLSTSAGNIGGFAIDPANGTLAV